MPKRAPMRLFIRFSRDAFMRLTKSIKFTRAIVLQAMTLFSFFSFPISSHVLRTLHNETLIDIRASFVR